MDESKRRKVQRCNSDDDNERSDSEYIPEELVMEMVSRLPVKSIVRCRLVSKLWSSITTTPKFINSFSSIRSSKQPCVLLTLRKDGKRFVFSANNNNPYKVESYEFTIPNNDWLRRYESVQGLVYLETPKQIMIWNPIMKRLFTLPTLEGHYDTGFLGYEPVQGKYKVMCLLREEEDKIGILTLGGEGEQSSSSSWRILSKGFPRLNYSTSRGRCINGVIYFEGSHMKYRIVSFDLRSEKFCSIKFPQRRKSCDLWVSYQGRLALVANSSVSTTSVELWILQDNQEEWIYKHFPSPPAFNKRPFNESKWTLKGITDSGEFIYSTYKSVYHSDHPGRSLNEALSLMYVDPENNTWREAKCGGIGVEDIHRLDEFRFDLIKDFTIIPNHIDSLMTL